MSRITLANLRVLDSVRRSLDQLDILKDFLEFESVEITDRAATSNRPSCIVIFALDKDLNTVASIFIDDEGAEIIDVQL